MNIMTVNRTVVSLIVVLASACPRESVHSAMPVAEAASPSAPAGPGTGAPSVTGPGSGEGGEAPAGEPALTLGGLFCTVYGGDGEGLPALWQQGVILKITNPMAVDLVVTKVSWRLDDISLASEMKTSKTIPAGGEKEFSVEKVLLVKDLEKIRAAGEVQVTVEVTLLKGDEALQLTARARLAPKDC